MKEVVPGRRGRGKKKHQKKPLHAARVQNFSRALEVVLI
jgi:hypothetical protein